MAKRSMTSGNTRTLEMAGSALVAFFGAGYAGNLIEEKFAPNVKPASPMNDKYKAMVANESLKVFGTLIFGRSKSRSPITKGLAIGTGLNFLVDMYLRYTNEWAPPKDKNLLGYPVLSSDGSTRWAPLTEQQLQDINNKMNGSSYIRQDYS